MGLLLVNISILFAREALLALVTLELALVFCWFGLWWMVFIVVGVQLFQAVMVTLANLTDEVARGNLKRSIRKDQNVVYVSGFFRKIIHMTHFGPRQNTY